MQSPVAGSSQPVATPIRFNCPFCGEANEVPAILAGCVAGCTHCSRDVTTPMQSVEEGGQPLDAIVVGRRTTIVAVPIAAGLGAMVGWLMLFVPVRLSMLSFVGIGTAHASSAGLIGALFGAFFTGVMTYWIWPDPPISAARRVGSGMVMLSVTISACLGAFLGSLLLLVPASYYMLSIIGIGVRHVSVAGILGALLGAFLGGLLGYYLCRE